MKSNPEFNSKNEQNRLPQGQHITVNFPILQKENIVHIDRKKYRLRIHGEVNHPADFFLLELQEMMDKEINTDIHCVTSWSKYNTKWKGVGFKTLLSKVELKSTARYVEFFCADDGFTTTVPINAIFHPQAILALLYEDQPITDAHGGPVRPIIPQLYFYKSAKWVLEIRFLKEDNLGYWEQRGYSNKADPWKNQRYQRDDEV
jgi:DMSO/TMAO reductase YedYZ molybdopterin-dependent catalytic subunit